MIPGQERDLSNTPQDRGLKLYSQDRETLKKEIQAAAVQAANRDRPRSAVPNRPGVDGLKNMSKSFVEMMHSGEGKIRVTPTYTSQVLPLTPSAPNLHRFIEPNPSQPVSTTEKWAINKADVIPERTNDDLKKKSEMYKMYMGLHDTPFQRYFREHYGDKHQTPSTTNVKKQRDNIGQTVNFNQYASNRDTYADLDAKGRRAKEMDSCVWAGNDGMYKSFQANDMTNTQGEKLSAKSSWKCKEASRKLDNTNRTIDTKQAQRDHLSSAVLPMNEYPAPKKHEIPSFYDQEHEAKYRKEVEQRNNPHKQRM